MTSLIYIKILLLSIHTCMFILSISACASFSCAAAALEDADTPPLGPGPAETGAGTGFCRCVAGRREPAEAGLALATLLALGEAEQERKGK